MTRFRTNEPARYLQAALLALPITVSLFYLMTRLIVPPESAPTLVRIVQTIQLQRAASVPAPAVSRPSPQTARFPQEPEVPTLSAQKAVEPKPTDNEPALSASVSMQEKAGTDGAVYVAPNPAVTKPVDWWAAMKDFKSESNDALFERWLLENGYTRYRTDMQGEAPTMRLPPGQLSQSENDGRAYANVYGNTVIQISENCVAQTQVLANIMADEWARNLPMTIFCKKPPVRKFDFDRD